MPGIEQEPRRKVNATLPLERDAYADLLNAEARGLASLDQQRFNIEFYFLSGRIKFGMAFSGSEQTGIAKT